MTFKIAGVVVLYNPDEKVFENINSYIDEIDVLYAVDNSDTSNTSIVNQLIENEKISYISNHSNLGIAAALNTAAQKAIEQGYHWLLTMDQDSKATEGMLKKLILFIENEQTEHVGILSPFHASKIQSKSESTEKYEIIMTTLTSGNLLNLEIFKLIGPFLEKLFIDYVDYEYCLRLNVNQYKVVKVNDAILDHHAGDLSTRKVGKFQVSTTNHSFLRRYYITRNRLYVMKQYKKYYPQFYRDEIRFFIKETVKIILFEKDKYKKLKKIVEGYLDFKRNKFGKYEGW